MPKLITQHTIEKHADALANYLPGGRLFQGAKTSGTKIRALLLGLAKEFSIAEGYLKTISNEYDINTTTLFISEWEAAVGIPDSCFKADGTIQQRRSHILIKLASLGIQTEEDFEELGNIIGLSIVITSGFEVSGTFPMTFPFIFFDTIADSRFTIVVDFTVEAASKFPLTFPFIFGSDEIAILECLFLKLKPANCNIIFRRV